MPPFGSAFPAVPDSDGPFFSQCAALAGLHSTCLTVHPYPQQSSPEKGMRHSPSLAPDAARPNLEALFEAGISRLSMAASCSTLPNHVTDDQPPRHRPLDRFNAPPAYNQVTSSSLSMLRSLLVPGDPAPRHVFSPTRSTAHAVPRLVLSAPQPAADCLRPHHILPAPHLLSRAPPHFASRTPPLLHMPFTNSECVTSVSRQSFQHTAASFRCSLLPSSLPPRLRLHLRRALRHVDLDAVLSILGHPDFLVWRSTGFLPRPQTRSSAAYCAYLTSPIRRRICGFMLIGVSRPLRLVTSLAPPVLHPLLPRIHQHRRFVLVCSAPSPSSPPHPFPPRSSMSRPSCLAPSLHPRPSAQSCTAYGSIYRTLLELIQYTSNLPTVSSIPPPDRPRLPPPLWPSVPAFRTQFPRFRFFVLTLPTTYLLFHPRTNLPSLFFVDADLVPPYTS
ncbi:hypothetical protein C8R45DRAFT_1109558 [Mycena sanguinolenta]|nr:hypothetical protein C8R45DRAFT_1109558 [Mycena sanguinolenta]